MRFPGFVSFTLTNACNLRCQMCAQWSEEGYIRKATRGREQTLAVSDWKKLVDELALHGLSGVLVRGGEPFTYSGIIELLEYISEKGMAAWIDTNGTLLGDVADDLARIGRIHVTISIDGPSHVHDVVRGVPGCFDRIARNIAKLEEAERRRNATISKSVTFTISPWSLPGLGQMPEVARSLGIDCICIVPYFYVPEALGQAYEREMQDEFGCRAFSWRGMHHETSGVNFAEFKAQWDMYRSKLGTIHDYPFLPLSEAEYKLWFEDPVAPVYMPGCPNVERLLDIQPSGDANFCVDFPDYCIGNVRDANLAELWNSERAQSFRERRRLKPFSACHRCGAKYCGLERS